MDTAPPPAPPAPPPAPPARGVTASSSESSASSTSRAPAQARPTARPEGPRSRASQAQTQRRLVLSSVRDHSKSSASGLDAALERGFLERLANVAPALRLERGRPRTDDLALRVMLLRLDEGGGRGAHDVTARCALDARPREALPNGALYAQGKQQGVEASDRIRLDAAERCGAQLAEAFAAVVR